MSKPKIYLFNLLNESSNSSSSSDSEEEQRILIPILNMVQTNCAKNKDFVEETVPLYTDREFMGHFRVSRNLVHKLADQYENSDLYPKNDTGYVRISAEKCLLIFLWYAGHEAASFRDVADRFNITISTLHSIIEKVSLFLSNMSIAIIQWPSEDKKHSIAQEFEAMGFPDVLGCMDGSHIRIDTPSEDPESYFNRKKHYSIQMQLVCDSNRKIIDIFIGYPGAVHDSRVFRTSPLFSTIEEKCGEKFILADSAYPCLRNVMTPYRDNGRLTAIEKKYNKTLSHCRILVEHTFGILKQKFRQLYHLKLRNITTLCHFIRACCVLYNLGIDDELSLELLENVDEIMENLNEEDDNDEEDGNQAGHQYRNYIASLLFNR